MALIPLDSTGIQRYLNPYKWHSNLTSISGIVKNMVFFIMLENLKQAANAIISCVQTNQRRLYVFI